MPSAIAPLTPDPRSKRRVERSVALLRGPAMAYWRLRHTKLTWSGVKEAQSLGPALVLANHSNILDPAMLVAAFAKPVHFLAADTAMEEPFEGRVSRFFGSIPKKKFALDMGAIRLIRRWAQLGASIGLFPEGERSWNSEPLPFVPGIERLVRMVNLPIVTAKILNAGRVWPRWAPRPRRGHVHIAFSAPQKFTKQDSDRVILEHIAQGLRITPASLQPYAVQGQDLARGLSNALYACPSCGGFNTFIEEGDNMSCSACATKWRIDTSMVLHHPQHGMPLHEAMQRAQAQIHATQGQIVEGPGPLLEAQGVKLKERRGTARIDQGLGRLTLHADHLSFQGRTRLDLPLHEIQTCSLDMRRKLILRQEGASYEALIPTQSALLWAHLIDFHRGLKNSR